MRTIKTLLIINVFLLFAVALLLTNFLSGTSVSTYSDYPAPPVVWSI